MKTKSQIMKEAHQIAKTFEGNYSACFSEALKISWKNAKENFTPDFIKIQNADFSQMTVKDIFNMLFWSVNSEAAIDHILTIVSEKSNGFQKDIAKKAIYGSKLSEKQAWCISYEFKKVA